MAWNYYRLLTIPYTLCGTVDSTDFPVLFSGSYSWLATVANGGRLEDSSGYDLIFALDSAGTMPLKYERVTHDLVTGDVEYYVKVPTLSTSIDTEIYILYGDASVTTDQSDKNATWDAHFMAVWHFGDGSTLDLTDSTSNGNNGTNHGGTAGASLLGGAGGGSVHFTRASTQYVDTGTGGSLNLTGAWTVEAQVRADTVPTTAGDFRTVFMRGTGGGNRYGLLLHDQDGGAIAGSLFVEQQGSAYNYAPNFGVINNLAANTTKRAGGGPDGTNIISYLDGSFVQSAGATTFPGSTSGVNGYIGRFQGGVHHWDGRIDELRISDIARSASWTLATANSLVDPSVFYSVGAENTAALGTAAGVTQSLVEAAIHSEQGAGPPALDVTQDVIEWALNPETTLNVTQDAIEWALHPGSGLQVTQSVIEVAYSAVKRRRGVQARYRRSLPGSQ